MILADKIVLLRKKFAWSQEELAEKMNVSRQSISKWESARSIPDLNKILMLSQIFGVSTDYLVKDEIVEGEGIKEDGDTPLKKVSLEEATLYVHNKSEAAKLVAIGAVLCVSSIIPLLILLGLSEQKQFNLGANLATAMGLALLFLMIAVGCAVIIRSNQYNTGVEKLEISPFELEYGVRGIYNEKLAHYKPIYLRRITVSIILFLTSVVPLLAVAILVDSATWALYMVVLLIMMIALGVYIIIPTSTIYNAFNLILGEGDYAPHKRKQMKRTEKLAGFYWPLVIAIYLAWSLWTMAWGITWIVWPVAAIAFAALIGLMGMFDSDDEI